MDERGQSTAEVAVALPALVLLVWWAVALPCAGLRSLAARVAVFGGVRRASCADGPKDGEVATWVRRRWACLAGGEAAKTVKARVDSGTVTAKATQEWEPLSARVSVSFRLPRERD